MRQVHELAISDRERRPLTNESLEQQLDLLNMIQETYADILERTGIARKAYEPLHIQDRRSIDHAGKLARPVVYAMFHDPAGLKGCTAVGVGYKFPASGADSSLYKLDHGLKAYTHILLRYNGSTFPLRQVCMDGRMVQFTYEEAEIVLDMARVLWKTREEENRLPHLESNLTTIVDYSLINSCRPNQH